MKLSIKNYELAGYDNFLQTMTLVGAKSRARTKLVNLIASAIDDYRKSELALANEYAAELDDNGTVVLKDDNTFDIKDGKQSEFIAERVKLLGELAVIDLTTYEPHIASMKSALEDCDSELSGADAQIYSDLYDFFEEAQNE
jgi:hypothetical protein